MSNYKVSQDLEIIPRKTQLAYTIPVRDWKKIQKNIQEVTGGKNNWYHIRNSCGGSAITLLISALFDVLKPATGELLFWIIFLAALVFAFVAHIMAENSEQTLKKSKEDIIESMTHIEDEFSNEQKGIRVLSARYFADEKSIDVTKEINARLSNDPNEFRASNELGGDPFYGKEKKLEVIYLSDGEYKTKAFNENDVVKLK